MGDKRVSQQGRLSLRKIILGFIFLSVIFIGFPYLLSQKTILKKSEEEENLIPSEVLNNRSKYSGEEIVMRGKVSLAPVVCQKMDCPANDSCCGCPDERDLLIVDPEMILVSRAKQRLKLLDYYGYQSFCQRLPSSCEYDCQDWLEGAIYDVRGIFFSEPPPIGLKLSLEQYFEVEDKTLVRKAGFQEIVENIFSEIKSMFGSVGQPGFYVLD